jgi:hypothetical protein
MPCHAMPCHGDDVQSSVRVQSMICGWSVEPFPLEVCLQLAVSAKFGAIFTAKIPGKFYVRTFTPWKFY